MSLNIYKRKAATTPLPENLTFDTEISQEDNLNATSKLWIQNNGTVFKQYIIYNELTEKNIDNLLQIASYKKLKRISELSMPLAIYENNGKVEGYLMKYHSMNPLSYYFDKREHSVVFMVFQHLAALINKLPKDVFIGDLHAGNILASKENIRVIDIDGFSLKHGHKISCPLKWYSEHSIFYHKKYRDSKGDFAISRDSDIACFLWLFLNYLMKVNPFSYTENELRNYMEFLKERGLPRDLYEMIICMMSPKHNYLIPKAFEAVPTQILSDCSYKDFIISSMKHV